MKEKSLRGITWIRNKKTKFEWEKISWDLPWRRIGILLLLSSFLNVARHSSLEEELWRWEEIGSLESEYWTRKFGCWRQTGIGWCSIPNLRLTSWLQSKDGYWLSQQRQVSEVSRIASDSSSTCWTCSCRCQRCSCRCQQRSCWCQHCSCQYQRSWCRHQRCWS